MSENTLEEKLSQANWTAKEKNDLGFTEDEMEVFNRIFNEIAEMKTSYPMYHPQEELNFYKKSRKQFLIHTRKGFK